MLYCDFVNIKKGIIAVRFPQIYDFLLGSGDIRAGIQIQ